MRRLSYDITDLCVSNVGTEEIFADDSRDHTLPYRSRLLFFLLGMAVSASIFAFA